MVSNTSESFIELSEEKFQKAKDNLSKLLLEDVKFLTWIAWCLDILFPEKTREEMYEFIGSVSDEELKKYIEPAEIEIKSEDSNSKTIFDKHFKIIQNGEVKNYLYIENQLNLYPLDELHSRGIYYLCSIIFWEKGREFNSQSYRSLISPVGLWIYPNVNIKKRKNTVNVIPLSNQIMMVYNFGKNGSLEPKKVKPNFILNSSIYAFYLGNPEEIPEELLTGNSKASRLAILEYLLDLHYSFGIDKNFRLINLENFFNLKGKITNEEVAEMNNSQSFMETFFQEGYNEGFNSGRNEGFNLGRNEGFNLGQKKTQKEYINKLANFILKNDNAKTREEALNIATSIFQNN